MRGGQESSSGKAESWDQKQRRLSHLASSVHRTNDGRAAVREI